jgi:hypothetical protein
MSFRFPGSSKGRAPTQNLIRDLDPKILENKEIFPNGQLKSSDIFQKLDKNAPIDINNFLNDLTGNKKKTMEEVINYYQSRNCIDSGTLSSKLLQYLEYIKFIIQTVYITMTEKQWIEDDKIIMKNKPTLEVGLFRPPRSVLKDPGNLEIYENINKIFKDIEENRSLNYPILSTVENDKSFQTSVSKFYDNIDEFKQIMMSSDQREFFLKNILSRATLHLYNTVNLENKKIQFGNKRSVSFRIQKERISNFYYTLFNYMKNDETYIELRKIIHYCCINAFRAYHNINSRGGKLTSRCSSREEDFRTTIGNIIDSILRNKFSDTYNDIVQILKQPYSISSSTSSSTSSSSSPLNYVINNVRKNKISVQNL